ncbi:hypothetical protein GYMLUDRAFT_32491 [Collybiopsis luxurians FD-317 M1]|nr:hypothetical protein GYMLUDRAFT_32491 [Collybiopsis luxurians FD-317 M1]
MSSPPSNHPDEPDQATDPTSQSDSSNNPTLPKAKISAFARFKTFTTSGFKSSPEPSFPPTNWDLSESPQSGSGASDWDRKAEQYKAGLDKWREEVKAINLKEKQNAEAGAVEGGNGSAETQPDSSIDQDPPDSRTLAMKIKTLIDEKFTFGTGTGKSSQSAPSTPGASASSPNANASGPVTPAENANSSGSIFGGLDATLAKFLSSETIMNGEVGKGLEKGRESVWAMLDKLGAIAGATDPSPSKAPGTSSAADKGKGRATEQDQSSVPPAVDREDDREDDGIMMYTPLQPTKDLEPEIAESELSYVDSEDQSSSSASTSQTPAKPASPAAPQPTKRTVPKPKRTFYPSSTKLSLQVTWWGYRLYLPPPIIAQLSSAHIAAAKRGAMITAALKWLIDQIPLMVIPPQMRASVLMLKRVSPYLGYVGAFVAWSWGRVQSNDQGQGVVLTATWLLPIAILPAPWDFEVHGRPRDAEGQMLANDAAPTRNTNRVEQPGEASTTTTTTTVDADTPKPDTESKTATPSTDRPSLFSSASRRWKSLRSTSTKEKGSD